MTKNEQFTDTLTNFINIFEESIPLIEQLFTNLKTFIPLIETSLDSIDKLLPTLQKTIPVVKKILPLINRSIPIVELFIPITKKIIEISKTGVPITAEIMKILDGNIESLIKLIVSLGFVNDEIEEKFNEILNKLPFLKTAFSSIDNAYGVISKLDKYFIVAVKYLKIILPQIEIVIKTSAKIISFIEVFLIYAEKIIPIIDYLFPIVSRLITASEKIIPMIEKIITIIEMLIPLVDSTLKFIDGNFSKFSKALKIINSSFKKSSTEKIDSLLGKLKDKILNLDPLFKLFKMEKFKSSISILIYKFLEIISVLADEFYKYQKDFNEFIENAHKIYMVIVNSFKGSEL